jgi:hypothetical protein
MTDATRPTDGNTNGNMDDKKNDDSKNDDSKNAGRVDPTETDRTADGRTADGRTAEKATPLGSDWTATAVTPLTSSSSSTTSSREIGSAIPTPRAGDTTRTSPRESTAGTDRTADRTDRTTDRTADRTDPSARPPHAPEPAPGIGSGAAAADNGRHVSQGVENGSLMPHDESDKFSLRLQHAVTGFVDEPRSAVEEADHVLEEVAARFTEAVTKRRATLHGSWESKGSDDTERLRLALRDYRELTERLLHL